MSAWPPRWRTRPPFEASDGGTVADFVETFCTITKDSVAGRTGSPLVPRDWQRALLDDIYTVRPDGRRLYRQGLVGMPRKNGKSGLGAGMALEGLLAGPDGAEVYSCAGDRDQARIVFSMAKRMVENHPELAEACKLYRDVIEVPATGSIYRVLSAEAYTKEGLSPTLVIFDELHVQPNDELWDVMTLGSGARLNPLVLGITTAGVRTDRNGKDSLCYRLYQYGRTVASGELSDPTFYFAWWEPMDGAQADHRDPKVWAECNPGYNDLIDGEDFASTVLRTPEPEFRTKRTNVFVAGTTGALPHGVWDGLADPDRTVKAGAPVVLMCDGAWSGDSTAIAAATIEEKPHVFLVDAWERPEDSPDWRTPLSAVQACHIEAGKKWTVREDNFDPFRWQQTMQELEDAGLPIAEFPNTAERMCKAWATFYDAVMDRAFTHDGNALLARHVENMVLKIDAKGARPVKEHKSSSRKIDAAICAIGALSRALWFVNNPNHESVYEERGILTL